MKQAIIMKIKAVFPLLFPLIFSAQIPFAAEPLRLGKHGTARELFVDGYLISKMSGDLKQHLHRPVAREAVLTTGEPWEGNTCAYYTIFRDGPKFRMYYRGSHHDVKTKKAGHRDVTCYAESRNGIKWTKPKLGLFSFKGSRENNIVLDGFGTHCFVAFKDTNPNCPPSARYKGITAEYPLKYKMGLYVFHSPDGIRWKQVRKDPVITQAEWAFDSQNLAFWDDNAKVYREYHRVYAHGKRAIMTSTSKDFIHWTKPKLLIYQKDAPWQHLYTNAVQRYERAPNLLIGFPTRYLPDEGSRVEPTFMASRDGLHFHRWLDPVIPETAPKDRGGNRSNYMALGIVEIPGRPKHYSVYATEGAKSGPDSRIRRFEYRKDGFVSIRGDTKGGQLTTKLIFLGQMAERLTLNFQTHKGGKIRVGLFTPNNTPIPEHDISDCKPLTGDTLSQNVEWKNGADIRALRRKFPVVQLRIEVKNADVYSVQFQPWNR